MVQLLLPMVMLMSQSEPLAPPPFPANSRVLFVGDSITDMNRGRSADPNHILGHSYAFLIGARCGASYPALHYEFINRGVSGNRIDDLSARWQPDVIDLKPTILSILVGINDVESGQSLDTYESKLEKLVSQTRQALPKTRIVLCEPFGLASGSRKDRWSAITPRLTQVQNATRVVAERYKTVYIQLQNAFDLAAKPIGAEYWIWDGIHPTYSGQQLLADTWLSEFGKKS